MNTVLHWIVGVAFIVLLSSSEVVDSFNENKKMAMIWRFDGGPVTTYCYKAPPPRASGINRHFLHPSTNAENGRVID